MSNNTCKLEDKGDLINNCYYIILDNTENFIYKEIDLTGGTGTGTTDIEEIDKKIKEIDKRIKEYTDELANINNDDNKNAMLKLYIKNLEKEKKKQTPRIKCCQ